MDNAKRRASILKMRRDLKTKTRVARVLLRDITLSSIEVAKMLCLSDTTLRRKLRKEGTSFCEIRHAVKIHTFRKMTRNGVGPGKLYTEALGFAKETNFYRFIQAYTGQSWTDYRRQANQEVRV